MNITEMTVNVELTLKTWSQLSETTGKLNCHPQYFILPHWLLMSSLLEVEMFPCDFDVPPIRGGDISLMQTSFGQLNVRKLHEQGLEMCFEYLGWFSCTLMCCHTKNMLQLVCWSQEDERGTWNRIGIYLELTAKPWGALAKNQPNPRKRTCINGNMIILSYIVLWWFLMQLYYSNRWLIQCARSGLLALVLARVKWERY